MLILKILKIKSFLFLSALNLGGAAYFLGLENIHIALVMIFGIVINQVMLCVGVMKMLSAKGKSLQVSLLMTGKFGILALTFVWIMRYLPNHLITLITCYIFQLIILTISIKRKTKNF